MLSRLLLACVLAAALGRGQAGCPEGCSCGPNEQGWKQVACENGGMTDSSFLNYIDFDTRVSWRAYIATENSWRIFCDWQRVTDDYSSYSK